VPGDFFYESLFRKEAIGVGSPIREIRVPRPAMLSMKGRGIFDRIIDFMALLAGILLVVAVLIVCWEIAMRYFVHRPLVWMVEVCEYILFSIAFLGAPWLLKKGGHVSVDVVTEHLSSKMQGLMRQIAMAAGVIFSAIVCWFSCAVSESSCDCCSSSPSSWRVTTHVSSSRSSSSIRSASSSRTSCCASKNNS